MPLGESTIIRIDNRILPDLDPSYHSLSCLWCDHYRNDGNLSL